MLCITTLSIYNWLDTAVSVQSEACRGKLSDTLFLGYDKRIDRKSLHRIFKTLTNEGCLRIYSIKLVKGNTKKQQTYVCHPDITFNHPVLQEKLCQVKEKAYCYINKKEDELIESVPETPKALDK